MRKKVVITILMVLFMMMPPLHASVGDSLAFSGNIAEMNGHFDMAIVILEQGDRELAVVHAGHPVKEYWILIGGDIRDNDPELFQKMDTALAEAPELAETGSITEFKAKVDEISTLLDQAEALIVPDVIRSGFVYKTRVILSLLETAESEYEVGVSGSGELLEAAEYQDSIAFVNRAKLIYQDIRSAVDEHEAEEIDQFFEELSTSMAARQGPSKVETLIGGIVHEMQEVADIEAAKAPTGPLGYIETIETLLPQLVHEYEESEYEEADELAVKAYLDNFEFVEGALGSINPELNEELEHMLREDLRELIKNRAPASEVKALVNEISEKLETAEGLLRGDVQPTMETPAAQPTPVVEKTNMAPWYGAVIVLLVIVLVETVALYKLKSEKR